MNPFGNISKAGDKKLSRIYKHLLSLKIADELVKEPMIWWTQNISFQISLSKWETSKHFKFTTYKRTVIKCFLGGTSFHPNLQRYITIPIFVGNVRTMLVHFIICGGPMIKLKHWTLNTVMHGKRVAIYIMLSLFTYC